MIAFRDGLDADWRAPAATSPGAYTFDVHGPYAVAVVCDDEGDVVTRQIARTPDDDRELDAACTVSTPDPISVTGRMGQPGSVYLGSHSDRSDIAGWDFHLGTTSEPHDLVALSRERIAIRRDQVFQTDAEAMEIDLEREGVALEPVELTAANGDDWGSLDALVELRTATTDAGRVYYGLPGAAKVAPEALRRDTDQQIAWMIGETVDAYQFVGRPYRAGDPTTFVIPDAINAELSTASGELVATWRTLPEHDALIVSAAGRTSDGHLRYHERVLSRSFMAATGAEEATLETQLPGYLPAWRIAFDREHETGLTAYRSEAGEIRVSALGSGAVPPSDRARRLPRPRLPQ